MKRKLILLPDQARGAEDDPFSLAKPSGGRGYVIVDDLHAAGYYSARPGRQGVLQWPEMHRWCRDRFGRGYTWAGSEFFFTNDSDRVLFAMRWS